ncbi:hypothetical protein [Hymenobacter sp. CRA2]|uniref:hypothetical protein n=1 Tax=Hymenobacter sp. CRA2 TaxID=1955620 RepID=UPI00098F82C8|nr:hypothetical protein [Hymenobacter sp. CRA2]OON67807.1 hypothetical protein B0919_16615 [Hymenobacter sp. CRA2]
MKAFDLLLDADDDLLVERNDFVIDAADAQHVDLLLRTRPGDWRADPLAGIGIARYLMAPYGPAQASELSREATIQLERDGYQILAMDVHDLTQASFNVERK